MAKTFKPCAVGGCKGDASKASRGFCRKHYHRLLKYGHPTAGPTFHGEPMAWLQENASYAADDCLTWPYGHRDGYACIGGSYASRAMCKLAHGEPPTPEHEAAHSCGMGHRGCLNPRHLRWATRSENKLDTHEHGTMPRGQRQHLAKLTDGQVREIRAESGPITKQYAEKYGVDRGTIVKVRKGLTWQWLA